MTADVLQKAVKKLLQEMQKKPSQRILRQGKQTLHQLKQHGASPHQCGDHRAEHQGFLFGSQKSMISTTH